MLLGEPTAEELAAREARTAQQIARTASATPTPASVEIAAVPAAPAPAPALESVSAVALVSATTDTTEISPAQIQTASIAPAQTTPAPSTGNIHRVTGKRVNLRSGPSTTNPIVGRAVRNDSAEVIEILPSGWAKVYILETGIEAYISAQFLSPAG